MRRACGNLCQTPIRPKGQTDRRADEQTDFEQRDNASIDLHLRLSHGARISNDHQAFMFLIQATRPFALLFNGGEKKMAKTQVGFICTQLPNALS